MSNAPVDDLSRPKPHLPEPNTERALRCRSKMSPGRWEEEVEKALWRVQVVRHVKRAARKGHGHQGAALREIAPGVHWSTVCYWRRCLGTRPGPEWERLLDGRVPPAKPAVPPEVRVAATLLRRVEPSMRPGKARELLGREYGAAGRVSPATLYRIWRQAGVVDPAGGDPGRFERLEWTPGGAAAVFLLAAAEESGAHVALASAALEEGRAVAQAQEGEFLPDQTPGREQGRFTRDYNLAVRQDVEPGKRDVRWDPESRKRGRRDLESLSVLTLAQETLGRRLLTMGMAALVTEQRGFDGMDAPRAHWLKVLGRRPYRPSTLDKTLAELGLLGVDEALWKAHADLWLPKAREWAGKDGSNLKVVVRYLDVTADPYWTRGFAKAGKVSRTGRVQPCLQRVVLTAGPGIPLMMDTVAGTADFRKALRKFLSDEASRDFGESPEGPRWLTIVDAEAAVPSLLTEMASLPAHWFVTVLKGATLASAAVVERGLHVPYRDRDSVGEAAVTLRCGLELRGVVVERRGTRRTHRTLFLTNVPEDQATAPEIADAYLSRWPNQEALFRTARHGVGLERSQGFCGENVAHVTLTKKQEQAQAQVERAEASLQAARTHALDAMMLEDATEHPLYAQVAREAASQAAKAVTAAEKAHLKAARAASHKELMPREIFERDTTRENVGTVLKMMMLALIEWVLREYFAGAKMEVQTYLAYFMYLPVETKTSWHTVRHRIDVTALREPHAAMVEGACQEISKRCIRVDGRRLRLETFRRPVEDL